MRFVFVLIACAIAALSSAKAQNLHSWVSAQGNDSSACTMAAPCATFSGAYQKTNAGGEVSCLNSGAFGGVFIQKSITFDCSAVHAEIGLNTPNFGSLFSVQIAPTDTVILRGLDLDCAAYSNATAFQCISMAGPGLLIVDHVKLSNSSVTTGSISGLDIVPYQGVAKVVVTDSIFVRNGGPSGGAGIRAAPTSSGGAQVTINRVVVSGNTFGIAFDTSQSGQQGINATVSNSTITSNANDAIVATTSSSGGPIGVTVRHSALTNNGYGIRSIGSGVTVRADGNAVIGNNIGVSAISGGALLTAGNNIVQVNGSNGSFSGPVPLN
ncbi:hypothetical protein JQ604_41265 [Bradyrhizobium jicamae]|uniref:hypothetical protein n=1 Tax=Bradyrhizobium jicamae TaxID=280332 RepID=UPI001BA499A2|nr:hypothetical protein [Bradyrhizobium jicamae]MBR0758650.1 hypothetical protein [Bradyrhizobium jicamae]